MFDRFTERARLVIVLAQEEAVQKLKHDYIGTEHILLGLLREEDGIAAAVLHGQGITVERVREQIVRIVGSGEEVTTGQIPFTRHAKDALEQSLRESLALGHNYIGTEHLLLALARQENGVAAQILSDFDVGAARIRDEVGHVLSGPGAALSRPSMPSDEPNPADPGPPIQVRLDGLLLGDLGNARVDARLLRAMLLRDGPVAEWLRSRSIDSADVEKAFPDSGWD